MSVFGLMTESKRKSLKDVLILLKVAAGFCLCIPLSALPSGAETPLTCSGLDLVSLNRVSPRPLFEIRYASSNNFLGQTLYPKVDHNYVVPWPWHYKTSNKILPRKDLD